MDLISRKGEIVIKLQSKERPFYLQIKDIAKVEEAL